VIRIRVTCWTQFGVCHWGFLQMRAAAARRASGCLPGRPSLAPGRSTVRPRSVAMRAVTRATAASTARGRASVSVSGAATTGGTAGCCPHPRAVRPRRLLWQHHLLLTSRNATGVGVVPSMPGLPLRPLRTLSTTSLPTASPCEAKVWEALTDREHAAAAALVRTTRQRTGRQPPPTGSRPTPSAASTPARADSQRPGQNGVFTAGLMLCAPQTRGHGERGGRWAERATPSCAHQRVGATHGAAGLEPGVVGRGGVPPHR
jgi:hypothetical protein